MIADFLVSHFNGINVKEGFNKTAQHETRSTPIVISIFEFRPTFSSFFVAWNILAFFGRGSSIILIMFSNYLTRDFTTPMIYGFPYTCTLWFILLFHLPPLLIIPNTCHRMFFLQNAYCLFICFSQSSYFTCKRHYQPNNCFVNVSLWGVTYVSSF